MGKALITSEIGEGKYKAKIIYNVERSEEKVSELTSKLSEIGAKISAKQTEVTTKELEISALESSLNSKINSGADLVELTEIVQEIAAKAAELAPIRSQLNALKAEKLASQKSIEFISSNTPTDQELVMWCADYSEGLSGEVGTIEPNGTIEASPIIYPSKIEGSAHSPTRDAQLQPIVSSGAPAVYFNRAIFPAWQKFKPTYRVGTIAAKSGDLCGVTLDDVLSDQDLNVNQSKTLAAVSIEYMTQNGLVFEAGDRVIIKFENQSFEEPKVIGFESNPKPERMVYILNDVFGVSQNAKVYINRHNSDGSIAQPILPETDAAGYTRNLEIQDGDFYYYYNVSNSGDDRIVRILPSGSDQVLANDCDRKFGVNSQFIFYHEADYQGYSRTIKKINRISGTFLGSFDVTIPNVSISPETRPYALTCNETNVFWLTLDDESSSNPKTYIVKSDLEGQNHEIVFSDFFDTSGRLEAWRYMRVTSDRVYLPIGFAGGGEYPPVPINCKVYDTSGNYIATFGPLPYATGAPYSGYLTMSGFSANENMIAWIEDTYGSGVFLHIWDRVITRNEQGAIVSESFNKRPETPVDISAAYGSCYGGLAV